MKYVFSDYTGDRLALLTAERERTLGRESEPSAEEAALRAGRDGEQAVVRRLLEQCTEPFELVTGYQSWHGEIDIVVITPGGIAAIEVKTLNADIAIDGDCWVKRRRNSAGEPTGDWYRIEDEGGRSPSTQVNEAADHLQKWFVRNGLHVPVRRWVVLAHERSRVAKVDGLTVDGVMTLSELHVTKLFDQSSVVPLSPVPVERARVLVGRDHAAFNRRRALKSMEQTRAAVPPVYAWPQAKRLELLVEQAKLAATQGRDGPAVDTLRSAIRHDLLVRKQPFEVPALLTAFRYDPPMRDAVVQVVDQACEVFEEPDRCLVALTIPVAVRLRKFLNGDYAFSTVNPKVMASIEGVSRGYFRLRRVAFDHRLYDAAAVRDIAPQAMRRYMLDIADRGMQADAPLAGTTLSAARDGRWTVVHVLGVAVFDVHDAARARRTTRLALPGPFVHHPLRAFDPDGEGCTVPGVMHETSSVGICTLSHGLVVGEQELRRLSTGVQAAAPESVFMMPLRYAL